MKTALYVEDGVTQVVLTPESNFETDVLRRMIPKPQLYGTGYPLPADIRWASFYETRGGWTMHDRLGDSSLIVRLTPECATPGSTPSAHPDGEKGNRP